MSGDQEIRKGLDGVIADVTAVSKVMPEKNSLTYRGYDVRDLCEQCSFEEVAYLLLNGELPNKAQLESFSLSERNNRSVESAITNFIGALPKNCHPMDVIRSAVSMMGLYDESAQDVSVESDFDKSIRLLAKIPTAIAANFRARKGESFLAPDPKLSIADNFYYMCFGKTPDKSIAKSLDVSLILYAEHGFNASTFTSRVVTSSIADYHGAVTAGIASLKGPLHGGANEAVMKMFLAIGDPSNAKPYLANCLKNKEKVMGFGHRVYKKGDSRVPTMESHFQKVAKEQGREDLISIYNDLKEMMIGEKNIYPNLDFPAGPLYHMMGFDIDFFTPIFVMARITGWSAHILEQRAANKLVRPLASYTGQSYREVPNIDSR